MPATIRCSRLIAGPLTQAQSWAHSQRKFFVLFEIAANANHGKNTAPMALGAVKRIGVLFCIEVTINRFTADQRLDRRSTDSPPPVDELQAWLQTERENLSRTSPVAKAIDYTLQR